MRAEIDEAVGVIGAREDYHLILEADQNPQAMPAVLYYNSQLDLTQQVVEYLNARYAQQEGSN